MHKLKIKLSTPEMVSDFIKVCSRYECDINLYDEKNVVDAKSMLGVFAISQGKKIKVQAISSDEDVILRFIQDMRMFEV